MTALQGGTCALQGAVHARDGGVEQFCDLGAVPDEDVAQDEDGVLCGGQPLQLRDEGEYDGLALLDHSGGIGQRRVGIVLQVRDLTGEDRLPATSLDRFQAGGGRDPVKPVQQWRTVGERARTTAMPASGCPAVPRRRRSRTRASGSSAGAASADVAKPVR